MRCWVLVKALSRLGDLIYGLIIIGLIAGFGWAALQALGLVAEDLSLAREMPLMVAAVALVVLLVCVVVLLEKAFPFVGFSERAWLYKYQPAGKWPAFTGSMVGQIMGVFPIAGALTFLVFPQPVAVFVGALIAAGARIAVGLSREQQLYSQLSNGRRRDATLALIYVDDADTSSNALAALWGMEPTAKPATASQAVIGLRRLVRRSYLLLIALAVVAATVIAAVHLGGLALVPFAVSWSLLAAGVYRAVSLNSLASMVESSHLVELGFLAAWAALGGVIATLVFGGVLSLPFLALFVVMVVVTGWWRGQPRTAQHSVVYDPNTGAIVPVGLLRYYSCAWPALVTGAVALSYVL